MKGMTMEVKGTEPYVSWTENIPSLLICPSCHKTNGGNDRGWKFDSDNFYFQCVHCLYSIPFKDLYERDLFWVVNKDWCEATEECGFLVYGNRPARKAANPAE